MTMNYNDAITADAIIRVVRTAVRAYATVTMRYKSYHATWKMQETADRYFQNWNMLEDFIDYGIQLLENEYHMALPAHIHKAYIRNQDLRETLITEG